MALQCALVLRRLQTHLMHALPPLFQLFFKLFSLPALQFKLITHTHTHTHSTHTYKTQTNASVENIPLITTVVREGNVLFSLLSRSGFFLCPSLLFLFFSFLFHARVLFMFFFSNVRCQGDGCKWDLMNMSRLSAIG